MEYNSLWVLVEAVDPTQNPAGKPTDSSNTSPLYAHQIHPDTLGELKHSPRPLATKTGKGKRREGKGGDRGMGREVKGRQRKG